MKSDTTQLMYDYLEGKLDQGASEKFEAQLRADASINTEWKRFLVEQYLADELPELWEQKMEVWRQTDPFIAQEIQFQQKVQEDLYRLVKDEVKAEVKQALPKLPAPGLKPSSSRFGPRLYLTLAAAAAIALLIAFLPGLWQSGSQEENLYAHYFEPYPMLDTERSSDEAAELENRAIEAYQNQEYGDALVAFRNLLETQPENPNFMLYAGISALETGEPREARSLLARLDDF